MICNLPHALPQRLISFVFANLLRKFATSDKVVADFRAQVKIWRGWDVTMSLANFRVVLSTVVKLWKELQGEDTTEATTDMIQTDIVCICAQFVEILRDRNASQDLSEAQNHAQQLLDSLQD
ncbi:hypothetical protein B0H13DRAFT_1712721, partial [Mycena leptocephala]